MSEIDDLREQRADTNRKAAALAAENLRLNAEVRDLREIYSKLIAMLKGYSRQFVIELKTAPRSDK